ncbi:hypothetical protein [uncultured Sunxiuqinia sp.]|uniref:hypothetical protein n=1 Tax=uncultured Sunxiuqinia sp. TaxID=1573825 RepID=UPI002AA790F7|nr:hypothetical protein [uncultured Sunxiuqinia sp.]
MEHEHRSDNDNCLMYYAAETSNFLSNFIGSSVSDLDQNCISDLQHNGGLQIILFFALGWRGKMPKS